MTDKMKWVSALSTRPSLEGAIAEAVEQAQSRLQDTADLAIVFISSAFTSEFSRLMPLLQEKLAVPTLIGCSGGGVIGVDAQTQVQEVEGNAALSLTLAKLPDVKVQVFQVSGEDLPDLDSPPDRWVDLIGVNPQDNPQFILLADPVSAGVNNLLQGLDYAYPNAIKIGGLASAGTISPHSTLFCNYQLVREGVVGLALSGNVVLEAIVAQGCRPIGQPYRVVEADRNILMQLEEQVDADMVPAQRRSSTRRTPLDVLQALFQDLSEADRVLAQHSLFVGIASNEFKTTLEQGDFLVRNLLGVDPKTGAIAVGDRIRPGQRIQFHLRDAETSGEDLELLLDRHRTESEAIGALMFSCLGRGEGLYGQPNYDSKLFDRYFAQVPVSGFFCNGEIGPVGNMTFLHGYTSVFGIVRQP
ncbi:FIST C-terminal domain-containing protein [Microcoleus sp. FACHB-1515]|nr:FIST N-terminal domain-containing protein [Microcoleus sp. FACHB-1515]MBD2091895.1 FIST C-terminal domain-containing protein [Microcoleus sp. FACHB-1515]